MRFASVRHEGALRPAVMHDDSWALLPHDLAADLFNVIAGGEEMLERVRDGAPTFDRIPLQGAELAAPLKRQPRDVLCTGWNYWDHFEEGRGRREGQDPEERPNHPTFFTKGPDTIIGPRDPIAYDPDLSTKWDYEAELAVVMGRQGRSIPEEQAMEHVWGYTLANDISLRDLQRAHGGQWLKGKSIDCTMPVGPWITTADEIDQPVELTCELNGQTVQHASTSLMAFPLPRLISELSWGMTIRPGQLVLTGTPAGVGNARNPQLFLQEGDEVVVRGSHGLGELRNRLVKTDLSGQSLGPDA